MYRIKVPCCCCLSHRIRAVQHPPPRWNHPDESLHCLCRDACVGRTVAVRQGGVFSKGFGSGNTAACRTFCSCWRQINVNVSVRTLNVNDDDVTQQIYHVYVVLMCLHICLTCCWGSSSGWLWWWTPPLLSHSSEGWTVLWSQRENKEEIHECLKLH